MNVEVKSRSKWCIPVQIALYSVTNVHGDPAIVFIIGPLHLPDKLVQQRIRLVIISSGLIDVHLLAHDITTPYMRVFNSC